MVSFIDVRRPRFLLFRRKSVMNDIYLNEGTNKVQQKAHVISQTNRKLNSNYQESILKMKAETLLKLYSILTIRCHCQIFCHSQGKGNSRSGSFSNTSPFVCGWLQCFNVIVCPVLPLLRELSSSRVPDSYLSRDGKYQGRGTLHSFLRF